MASFVPVRHNPTTNRHEPAPSGHTLEPGFIPVEVDANNLLKNGTNGLSVKAADFVSTASGNLLSVGSDGKLSVNSSSLDDGLISKQDGNYVRYGSDKGVYLDGNDILSNGSANLISIHPTDKKIYLDKTSIQDLLGKIVSSDAGNIITTGSDGGAYLDTVTFITNLVSGDTDNDLTVGSDGKLKVVVVSKDAGNNITRGSDRGAHLPADLGTM